ncbi:MAG TPA: hypothetical protein VKX17_07480 [Planctomycetota bacterium]|nr:hypothetical protein [Planctomycetota bacterium]
MPNPPRRARFQIHLSTAIVLMFVAGGLMWLNFIGGISVFEGGFGPGCAHGFPFVALEHHKVDQWHKEETFAIHPLILIDVIFAIIVIWINRDSAYL